MREPTPETSAAGFRDIPVLLFIRGLALLLVMSSLIVGLHYYLGLRLIRDAAIPEPFATAAWATLWVSFASIFGGFIGGRLLGRRLAKVLQWVGCPGAVLGWHHARGGGSRNRHLAWRLTVLSR